MRKAVVTLDELGRRINATDAGIEIGVSSERIRQLVKAGRLTAIHTRNGYLLDPLEVAKLKAQRQRA